MAIQTRLRSNSSLATHSGGEQMWFTQLWSFYFHLYYFSSSNRNDMEAEIETVYEWNARVINDQPFSANLIIYSFSKVCKWYRYEVWN